VDKNQETGICIKNFSDWLPGARTAYDRALCHWIQLYRYFVSRSSEFCHHNTLCFFSTSVYCKRTFRYDSVRKVLDTPSYRPPVGHTHPLSNGTVRHFSGYIGGEGGEEEVYFPLVTMSRIHEALFWRPISICMSWYFGIVVMLPDLQNEHEVPCASLRRTAICKRTFHELYAKLSACDFFGLYVSHKYCSNTYIPSPLIPKQQWVCIIKKLYTLYEGVSKSFRTCRLEHEL